MKPDEKRVLCVCTMGLLRSPTAAWVLSNDPFNWNTRSAGTMSDALVPLSFSLLDWADEFVVMQQENKKRLQKAINDVFSEDKHLGVKWVERPVHCFDVPDEFEFRQPELVELLQEKFAVRFLGKEPLAPFADFKMPHERG